MKNQKCEIMYSISNLAVYMRLWLMNLTSFQYKIALITNSLSSGPPGLRHSRHHYYNSDGLSRNTFLRLRSILFSLVGRRISHNGRLDVDIHRAYVFGVVFVQDPVWKKNKKP